MSKNNQIHKANILTAQGEIRLIHGEKTLILPCVEPEYIPRVNQGKRWSKNKSFKRQQ